MKHITSLAKLVEAFTNLEDFKWVRTMTLSQFLEEFSERAEEVKKCSGELSDLYLALRLLKSANLDKLHCLLDNLNIAKLTYAEVKKLVCKLYKDTDNKDTDHTDVQVTTIHEVSMSNTNHRATTDPPKLRGWSGEGNINIHLTMGKDLSANKTLPLHKEKIDKARITPDSSKRNVASSVNSLRHGRNPSNKNNVTSKCVICRSINHWAINCPDQSVHQVDIDPKDLEHLVKDTCDNGYSSTIFSTEVSKSVCGLSWLKSHIESLSPHEKSMIRETPSSAVFNFRETGQVASMKKVTIPLLKDVENHRNSVNIEVEVVHENIPLLLSRATLIKGRTRINHHTKTVDFAGSRWYLNFHDSGYYFMLSHNKTPGT